MEQFKEKLKAVWHKITAFALSRKKRFYIILIVISTLVLLMDLSVRLFLPNTSMLTGMQNGTAFSEDVTFPDSTESSGDAAGDFSSGMTMPDSDTTQDFSDEDFTGGETSSLPDTDSTDSLPSGDMQDFSSGFASGDAASVPDTGSSDDSTFSGGSMPDMGSTDSDMTLPDSDSTLEDDTAGADSDEASEETAGDTDTTEETDTSVSSGITIPLPLRILMGIRAAFWPILILALLVDALSIVLLIMVSRRSRRAAEEAERERIAEAFAEDGQVHLVRPQQKKKKISPFTWIAVIVVIILLVLLVKILSGATTTETSETEATIYSAEVESGDISTVLPGTGTLTEEDAVEVSLPSEVEITEWYVSNGDTVEVGDTLAQIDTDSALSAIASVQEVITSLDEALSEAEDSDTTQTVTATAGGRVKAVYAEEDVSVIDTIYESEALILLSLDGMMAVTFETDDAVSVGDDVTVTLSDGTETEGSVESALEGVIVVTLTDEDTDLGDSVTVTGEDGNTLGTGELYIHSELKILAFSGTVSSISVSVEDEVDAGDTLLSLEDVDNSFEVALLVEQRSELEEQIGTLFKLYQDGYLYAETAGVISGLTDTASSDSEEASDASDSGTEDSNTEESGTTQTSASAGSSRSAGLILTAASSESTENTADSADSDDTVTESSTEDDTESTAESTTESTAEDSGSADGYVNYIGVVTAVGDDAVTVLLYEISSNLDSASLEWTECTVVLTSSGIYTYADGTLAAGSSTDIAVGDTLIVMCSAADTEEADELTPVCVISISNTVSDTSDTGAQDDTTDEGSAGGADGSTGGTDDSTDGTQDAQTYDSDSDTSTLTESDLSALLDSADTSDSTSYSTDDAASALTAATESASAAVTETLTESVSTSYSVSETTLCSVTPQDYVYVTITIDELDILSVEEGQEAEVTLDAFPGQSFTGVVESIDTSGTNSGGNSKYTAVIRIDREEDMLAGMNASVKITLETTEDVLYVPAEAIVEDDTGTYVYTSYDEKTDTLGDPVEVETGISDGSNVEIVSGLSEGDTYYYSVLDTVNYSSSYVSGSSGLW